MQQNIPARTMQIRADTALLVATFFWGWTFPVTKDAIGMMPIFAFLALRFALAAVLMAAFTGVPSRATLKQAAPLGILLFLSFAFQTLGLAYTTASNSAFITGLSIVWVALYGARDGRTWAAVGLSVCGLWLLAAPDLGGVRLGEALALACSFFFACHLILLSRLDKTVPSGALAMIQFAMVAVFSLCTSLVFEESLLPPRWTVSLVVALAVTVLGATIFSFWVQTHFQRYTTATRAALIFIMEPVFAATFAVLFYGEELSGSAVGGAALVFMGMLLAIWRERKTAPHFS